MKKSLCYLIFGAISFTLFPGSVSARIWTDNQGRTVDAQFIKLEDGNVHIRTPDGRRHSFALENLSHADQVYARTAKAVEENVPAGNLTGAARSAAIIDQIIERDLLRNKLSPNDRTTDSEFFRRVYLDIAGTIPNFQQTKAFLEDPDPDKRSKMIDKLLDSEDYASHFYNYFADILRLRNRLSDNTNVSGDPYVHWVKTSIKENKPYDKMVHEMLTAEGKVWNNPAAGYLLRDAGMPLDNLANTVSIFLGTEIACAQCHDHPFDDWTQMEFYEMAAFFGATSTQYGGRGGGDTKQRLMGEIEGLVGTLDERKQTNLEQQLDNLLRANRYVVGDMEENRLRLPNDYKYDDAKPNDPVSPRFIFSKKGKGYVKSKKGEGSTLRTQFADWAVSKENPRFAMVIANRLWKRAFGVAVHDPVDDIPDPQICNNPELLEFLEAEMKRLDFNLKEFQRIIYNTAAYQRKACAEEPVPGEPFHFQGPALRRMTAEQMWDSFVTLVLGDPNKYKNEDNGYYQRAMDVDLDNATGRTVLSKLTAASDMRGGMMMGNQAESLAGMRLMRASELSQPEGESHFLRQFGQSDRVLIEQSSTEGTVPQVLMMLNGKATHMLTDPKSLIFQNMETEKAPAGKVEVVFLSILNRKPSLKERALAQREINKNGEWGYGDLIWALINTREFMFIR